MGTIKSKFLFNKIHKLPSGHAFLSPSGYHWVNYDTDKLITTYRNSKNVEYGTELHELAAKHIKLGIKMPKNNNTLNAYINDAIGYAMTVEQTLFYNDFCFGTADAISYKDNILRIFDLKTGFTPASMVQLHIYAALFCLEYNIKPRDISNIELRIYQNNEIIIDEPPSNVIDTIISKIITSSETLKKEVDTYV